MHFMALVYSKEHEDSGYPNVTTPNQNASTAAGDAPAESQGSSPGEPATVHAYHGYVSMPGDVNAVFMKRVIHWIFDVCFPSS